MLSASDRAAKSVEDVSTAADKVETSLDKAGKSGKKAKDGFESAGEGAEKARKKVKGMGDEVDKTKTKAEKAAGVLGKLFAAKTALDVGGKLLNASDNYMNANTRLGLINKADASGGDISETVITTVEASQDEYPVPAAGDSAKTVLGKVQKFFADIRNWMTGVCLLGQIVNNCVTDNAKLPLSAAQGKVLMDLYNVLNTNQKNAAPKNHASTANTYGLGSASSYGHVKLSDSYTASGGAAANGVCASSKAVNEVYKKFNAENTTNSGQNIQSITSSADNLTWP